MTGKPPGSEPCPLLFDIASLLPGMPLGRLVVFPIRLAFVMHGATHLGDGVLMC
jgi:hypothetical protein